LSIRPEPLENPLNTALKRVFDILFSGLFLIFFPLILIPVAIAIKISSPGPVFFKQKRTGLRGKDFYCYKFRTMRVNDDSDRQQATKDDPRKTKLGDFLRRTSIDELPQFWNVFKGDMSVVGPRPHMIKHTEDYSKLIDTYMLRHLVKPGITGWAQVNGYRGETKELWQMAKRVQYDVWYIENWDFFLDLKIIYLTVANALRGEKNAY
jgi:putative colanic acid biosynthesis UDP-glucose lipid carrier transferase